MNEPATIREILDRARTIAVVGLTNREGRASLGVSRYMQSQGYRILPVNPQIDSVLGEKAFADLDEAVESVGGAVELVNVFRAPEHVPE
ncbi:MAG: CoA-binding protein, partial [Acidobacteriaceae bacterium]